MKNGIIAVLFLIISGSVFSQAVLTEIHGTVEIQAPNAEGWTPAEQGGSIAEGTLVSTGCNSSVMIAFGAARVLVRPLSRIALETVVQNGSGDEIRFFLHAGRVRADVFQKTSFVIQSPVATVVVHETAFDFDTVNLRVDRGVVQYSYINGQAVYVAQAQASYAEEKERRLVSPQELAALSRIPQLPLALEPGSIPHIPVPGGGSILRSGWDPHIPAGEEGFILTPGWEP